MIKRVCRILLPVFLLCLGSVPAGADVLELPPGLLELADSAFRGDTSLSEVRLPDGMKTIGPMAFAESSVTRVYLPDSLVSIDPTAFDGCENVFCWVSDGSSAGADFCLSRQIPYEVLDPDADVTRRALVIGESLYTQTLSGPDNDAACMENVLAGLGGWTVLTQTDCTRDEIGMLVSLALGGADEDDVSLFYYSGHGVTGRGEYYAGALQTVDDEYITMQALAEMLSQISGRVIVILDSCGSGAAVSGGDGTSMSSRGEGGIDPVFDPERFNSGAVSAFSARAVREAEAQPELAGRSAELRQSRFVVLTASGYEENSRTILADGVWGSVMTRALTAGIGCAFPSGEWSGAMPADTDSNGALTLSECFLWCSAHTADEQHVSAWPLASGLSLFFRCPDAP